MLVVNNYPFEQVIPIPKSNECHLEKPINEIEILVKSIQSKSEKGFHILYDKYSHALYGIIMKFVNRSDIAEDLLQETFIKIWKYIDMFDSTKGTFFTWMLNIARNQSIDYLRSSCHKKQTLSAGIDVFTLHMDYLGQSFSNINEIEFKDFKTKTYSQLDRKYTEVIDMILFYGCTHEQTAKILNLSIGTVKTRIRKGFELLKELYLN